MTERGCAFGCTFCAEGQFGTIWRKAGLVNGEMKYERPMRVRGRNPKLVVQEMLEVKDRFNITFLLSNEGTGIARDAQITAATSSLPFVPAGADTKIVKNLQPGESIQMNFPLMVKDKTVISSYSIPIKMDYKDETGKYMNSQSLVGVKILGNAELSIESIETEPQNPVKGDPVSITMRIENSGNGDARSVKVDLNIPFEGTKTAFLGKINILFLPQEK
jgi:hypothetical protein